MAKDGEDVKYITTSYLVDFNGFISSLGGGLGLFVGFSMLSTLTMGMDYVFGGRK